MNWPEDMRQSTEKQCAIPAIITDYILDRQNTFREDLVIFADHAPA